MAAIKSSKNSPKAIRRANNAYRTSDRSRPAPRDLSLITPQNKGRATPSPRCNATFIVVKYLYLSAQHCGIKSSSETHRSIFYLIYVNHTDFRVIATIVSHRRKSSFCVHNLTLPDSTVQSTHAPLSAAADAGAASAAQACRFAPSGA